MEEATWPFEISISDLSRYFSIEPTCKICIDLSIDEIEKVIGYKLEKGLDEPVITPLENRNHFGIHRAKQEGEAFIGFATNSGRVDGKDFKLISDICNKYKVGGMALTSTQNFIIYGVKDEDAQDIADEIDALGYPYAPTPFRARLQSCTGREFCKFGITETKEYAKNFATCFDNSVLPTPLGP